MDDRDLFGASGQWRVWSPQADVFERDAKLVVRADVLGVKKEDVKMELTDSGLFISGERKFEQDVDEGGMRRFESSSGSFQRLIPVPQGVDAAQAEARFENGVLEVTLPLPKEARQENRRIEIRDKGQTSKGSVH